MCIMHMHVASNTCEVVNCLSGGDAVSGHTHVLTSVSGTRSHVPHVQRHPMGAWTHKIIISTFY